LDGNPEKEKLMLRLFTIIWSIIATVLMGVFVLAVLTVPALAQKEMLLILPAAVAGALVAAPLAYLVTKKLLTLTGEK
jgi:hypothetical protein